MITLLANALIKKQNSQATDAYFYLKILSGSLRYNMRITLSYI